MNRSRTLPFSMLPWLCVPFMGACAGAVEPASRTPSDSVNAAAETASTPSSDEAAETTIGGSDAPSPEAEAPAGSAPDSPVQFSGDGTVGRGGGGIGDGVIGLGPIGAPSAAPPAPTAEEQAAAQAQARERTFEYEAAYQARCGSVTLVRGVPPAPPPAPRTPGLRGLRPIYRASLTPAVRAPRNRTPEGLSRWAERTFLPWVTDAGERLGELDEAAASLSEQDLPYALAWLAHANATFTERFHAVPVPEVLASEPELRRMYLASMSDQSARYLDRSGSLIEGVVLPGAWAAWKANMQAWLAQEACALH